MPTPSSTVFSRSAVGSLCLLAGVLLMSACGMSETAREPATRTLHLTAIDSSSGEPLDSAQAVNRTLGDSLETDSAGQFVLRDPDPALYVFDVGGYGYHTQRHVGILVEPEDTTLEVKTSLLPMHLQLDCSGDRPFNWDTLTKQYEEDSTRVRIQLIDVFAQNGRVRVQPVVVNDLPTTTLFLPNSYGALDHYEVQLYDENNNPVPYRYENAPPDEGHRIYSKEDIRPVVPQDAQRLDPTTLIVEDSLEEGTTLYARMAYTFSSDDTLEATSATTFPDLDLDSLQTPVFDTLRTDGRVQVPDSLVIQRDTTRMQVVGIDTTVTRSGYLLFSTLRDSNAAPSPEAARNLLYVPDSVKARARRDSLLAAAEADTTVPPIDTSAVPGDRTRFHVVNRTDRSRLDSLVSDDRLIDALSSGLPNLDFTADSLLALSPPLRGAFLQTPTLSRDRVRRGVDTAPDTTLGESVLLSAPLSDSLFQMFEPDTLTVPDTGAAADWKNPFLAADSLEPTTPDLDSISTNRLPLTVSPEADSVVVDSVVTETLSNPPSYTYWPISDSHTSWETQVLVVDSAFFNLRARSRIDTSATINVDALLPKRVGPREQLAAETYPQQVIRSPTGTYRSRYLQTWRGIQSSNLSEHYCQILPFPLRSEWRSTSMH